MSRISDYISRSLNQRTIYGLIALAGVLGIALIARLSDEAANAATVKAQFAERLARQGGEVDEVLWRERADGAQGVLDQWKATRWSGPTPGFIAAALQSEMNRIASLAQLSIRSLQVDPAPVDLPGGAALRFRIVGDSPSGDSAVKMLAAINAHRPMIVVTEMNVTFTEDTSGRFSAEGYAPIAVIDPTRDGDS